ncbi:hypothetical protein [Pseudoteredinibacter isoporae]|uniref:hypothetical protein n=1 Tax=Pseudoteredinibacter isoporae TaxID=570281 RepID=UPI00310C1ADC
MKIFKGTALPIILGLFSLSALYFKNELSNSLFPVEPNSLAYSKAREAQERLTALNDKLEGLTVEQSTDPETGLMSKQKIEMLAQVKAADEEFTNLVYESVKDARYESRQNTKKLTSFANFFFFASVAITLLVLSHNLYKEVWPKIREEVKRKKKLAKNGSSEDQIKKYRLMLDNGVITKKEFSLKMSMIRQQEGFTPIAQKTESKVQAEK